MSRRLGQRRLPPILGVMLALGVALVGVSSAFLLYDRISNWGKLVHGFEALLVAVVCGYCLLGYRDYRRVDIPAQIVALVCVFAGVTFGVFWEFLEFALDWIRASDIQKSNADTMTDMLWGDLAAVLGTFLVFSVYRRWTSPGQRLEIGQFASALFGAAGRVLDQYGKWLGLITILAIAAYIAALWTSERPLPFIAPR